MSKTDKEVPLITNELTTIISAIVSIQKSSLADWCNRNNWSNLQSVQLQFYAIPPGGDKPVPLPKAAFALLNKYQKVFDILWEIRFLEQRIRWGIDKVLMFNIACIPILFIKAFLKTSNAFVSVPVVYQIFDLSVAMLIITTLVYLYGALFSHWQCRQHEKKLRKTLDTVDLLASLNQATHLKNLRELT